VERPLGLMCGAGVLPARMASVARRRGWRVVAFTFDAADGVGAHADAVVPSRIDELGTAFEGLRSEGIADVLFSGRFSMPDVLRVGAPDATFRGFEARARSRSGAAFVDAIIAMLTAHGVRVLDQRDFVGDWLVGPGPCSARPPTDEEWSDARAGLALARTLASARIGQTVVIRHGAVVAVEAVEGTTEAVRRGAALGGRGAVVVKAVAPDHDYRFDAPAIGPETLAVAAEGGVAAVAIEANRVMLFDRAEAVRLADAAGIAVIGIDSAP
jgi:UDP-2,3-diacylglucosamine hydrolase